MSLGVCRWRGCALCDITVRTEQGRRFCVQYNLPQNNGNRVTITVLPRHRGLCRNGFVFYGHCGIGHDVKFKCQIISRRRAAIRGRVTVRERMVAVGKLANSAELADGVELIVWY